MNKHVDPEDLGKMLSSTRPDPSCRGYKNCTPMCLSTRQGQNVAEQLSIVKTARETSIKNDGKATSPTAPAGICF